ncbi:MAG: hypothetical protein ACJ76K_06340 [Solirubrobacteraceae bacterium]
MDIWPWVTLVALGAYHGLNPAMGWLFAVSRGMQERSRRAVVRSLLPIAIGHELALVVVAAVVLLAAEVVDPGALHVAAAAVLLAFGIFRFLRPRAHPRWTTMRVNGRELTLWSFLMSSAHGAGLIVAPVLIGIGSASASTDAEDHVHASADVASLAADGVGLALHVAAMVLVMGVVAVLVYDRLGVAVLRKAWLNTDQLWAAAFIVAAAITLFI